MKHDEREKQKKIYYKEQQERISLYLKHNTKEPNTIKFVNFTKLENSPMGSAVIKGYINNKKDDDFENFRDSCLNTFLSVFDMLAVDQNRHIFTTDNNWKGLYMKSYTVVNPILKEDTPKFMI